MAQHATDWRDLASVATAQAADDGKAMTDLALVQYDAMCAAIAECVRIDEVTQIRDQAHALQAAAKIAHNREAEKQCALIHLRAERRAGELLRDMEERNERRSRGQPRNVARRDISPTLQDIGISRDESSRWQRLADIPDDVFAAAVSGKVVPSARKILRALRLAAMPEPEEVEQVEEVPAQHVQHEEVQHEQAEEEEEQDEAQVEADKCICMFLGGLEGTLERYEQRYCAEFIASARAASDDTAWYVHDELERVIEWVRRLQDALMLKDEE